MSIPSTSDGPGAGRSETAAGPRPQSALRRWAVVPLIPTLIALGVVFGLQATEAPPAPTGGGTPLAAAASLGSPDTRSTPTPAASLDGTSGSPAGSTDPSGTASADASASPGASRSDGAATPTASSASSSTPRVTAAPTPRPTSPPTPQPSISVSGSYALGLWAGQPWEPGNLDAAIALIGRTPAIFSTYQDWAHRPADYLAADANVIASRGASWMVTWQPFDYTAGNGCQSAYSLKSIARGDHDAFIRSWAKAAAAWGGRIYLRFMHEMNGDWYPWAVGNGCNSAADFVAAWKHTHDLFTAAGAKNVKWVWSPNVRYGSLYPFANLWPGSSYVDWIGLDGYNWGGQVGGHPGWESLRSIFQATYNQVLGYGKPIMIAETASAQAGGDKAAWIRNGYLSDIPNYLPAVRAVIYFNQNAETNFRIDSSTSALSAFQQVAATKAWKGRIP